jgi:hypothetical protein
MRTFRPLHAFKLDKISLLQPSVALTIGVGLMNEKVGAVIAPNKNRSRSNLQGT